MKILGDSIFAKNPDGTLKSRIGTLFFRTPGLVTAKGVHAMQRIAWVKELSRERVEQGGAELSESEAMAEWADSADLLFTNDYVLIRPDPNRMDLAFKADDVLQTLVSKRKIRFLNTHSAKVRDALRARGENWRMARAPLSQDDIVKMIESAHVAIDNATIYYYNGHTGTRFLTVGGCETVLKMRGEELRRQVAEIVKGIRSHNRLGQPEIALFPIAMSTEIRNAFAAVRPDAETEEEIVAALENAVIKWRMALPPQLRDESPENLEWRNEMSALLGSGPNDTNVDDQDLIQGISPEFFRQIEWLPGCRVENGRLIFDSLFDEANRTQDPELLAICDHRVRSMIFNLMRIFGSVEYVNVGRISHSLSLHPVQGRRRGNVYIIQYKQVDSPEARVFVIRFQKWGIAEHLDEGKDLLQAMLEAGEYADYILDRRLACRQLGMNLPHHVSFGQFTETYFGNNQYNGSTIRTYYYVRSYVTGVASDKVPPKRFRNPAFALAFSYLMGEAAALDMVVGRASTETGEPLFDKNYEVLKCGADGLPVSVVVTDHAGSFVKYREPYSELVANYAGVVRRRESYVADFPAFAKAFVKAFERKLEETQQLYRSRKSAYDELFLHRPYNRDGSGAYRWHCTLKRLDECNPAEVAEMLKKAIQA